jgi:hypothetical protein
MSASRTRSRTGGLRIGLVVCTVVVLTAACGSIDVVTGDGGGSGGTPGGGSGGMHPGGSSGSGGAHGSGGTIGGGTGGTNRGSGGNSGGGSGGLTGGGSGGITGSGGDAGAGGAGGSGPSCSSIQKAFAIALANAKSCVVGATGYCGVTTPDKLDCGCPTHVNDTKEIDPIRTQWAQSGCSSGVCPGLLCIAYKGAVCAVPSGGTAAVCTDTSTLPTP